MRRLFFFFLLLGVIGVHFLTAQTSPVTAEHGMTQEQATTWVESHWQVKDIVPIVRDLSTLLQTTPSITGPQMVALLGKDGTLHVYWTSPNATLTWQDPNYPSKILLEATVPLPTLTQPNFYKPPGFPFKAVAISTGAGLGIGVIGTLVAMFFIK